MLCGSFRCGCGITSTPATEGAIDGFLPTIDVSGSGEGGDPYDLKLNEDWANAVASQLNDLPGLIASGMETVNTDPSGDSALSFGVTFAAAPVVIIGRVSGSTGQMGGHAMSITTTGCAVRLTLNNAAQASVSGAVFTWIAIGAPA